MDDVLGPGTIDQLIEQGAFVKFPDDGNAQMIEMGGIPLPIPLIQPSDIDAMKTWQARSDDVFVVSYPKAGTTWTQEVVSAICNNGDLQQVNKSHTMIRVPFMESTLFTSTEEIQVPPLHELTGKMKSPRTIKSHLPGHMLPPDIMQKKARIVYISRNPKDVAVSFFYFHKTNPSIPTYKSWDEFFNEYFSGNVAFGPWWSHYLYYWNKRNEPNVLFLKFEDMKRDLKGVVQKIANFLGYTFTEDVIDGIVNHCTFKNMKENPMTNPDALIQRINEVTLKKAKVHPESSSENEQAQTSFMRKGKVGDWRNHFTVAQNEAMDAQIQEKLAGSGLTFNY